MYWAFHNFSLNDQDQVVVTHIHWLEINCDIDSCARRSKNDRVSCFFQDDQRTLAKEGTELALHPVSSLISNLNRLVIGSPPFFWWLRFSRVTSD